MVVESENNPGGESAFESEDDTQAAVLEQASRAVSTARRS